MEVEHLDKDLERLESDDTFAANLGQPLIKAFRKVMQLMRAASDERDFYALKSLRFEKLSGKRKEERSMRLNDQWRLIVKFKGDAPNKKVIVKGIEDYH